MRPDTLIVLVIVAVAAFFVIRRLVRQYRASDTACGCSGGCEGCKSAPTGLGNYAPGKDANCSGCPSERKR
jgi:hypothetical protein